MTGLFAVSFSFPSPTRRLTLNDRMHWTVRANRTREWRRAAGLYALQARRRGAGYLPPSDVYIEFAVGDPHKRRDPHNTAPTIKAVVDGLVDAGYWPDDTAEWVTVIDPAFVQGPKGIPRVTVHIQPRQERAA